MKPQIRQILFRSICVICVICGFAQSQTLSDKSATATITGKVTIKGEGVAGIVVGLNNLIQDEVRSSRNRTTTDEDGNYRLTNIQPGRYEVIVASPTHVPTPGTNTRKPLIINKGETVENIDFALVRGGVITGRVTDSEGRPVIEIEVSISPVEMTYNPTMRSGVLTDDRGVYRAFGLPPGKYKVFAGHEDRNTFGNSWLRASLKLTYHPAVSDASQAPIIEVTEDSETANVDITMGRGSVKYTASGRIVDGETGKPLGGVRYGIYRFEGKGGSSTSGQMANSEGEFRVPNLTPGKYAVTAQSASDGDWQVEPVYFEVVDEDVTGLIVKTSKGGSASGVIVLEGGDSRAIPNPEKTIISAQVMFDRQFREGFRRGKVNADGSFRIDGLPAGRLSLYFSSVDNRFQLVRVERDGIPQAQGMEIKNLEQVTGLRVVVSYANGTIRGVIKFPTGSLPAEARLSAMLKRTGDDPNNSFINAAEVDSRGQFIFERVLPGNYEVTATVYYPGPPTGPTPKIPPATQQVVVTNGNVSNVTLTLTPE